MRMKKIAILAALCSSLATGVVSAKELKVGLVNFKTCVENSKLGQKEQENFDALKKQMESLLGSKEKELQDLSQKLNDADYLDSISAEAETELKRKARNLQQELAGAQQQFYQALQQANFKVVQELSEKIGTASKRVAQKSGFDLILNDEVAFFTEKSLDVSDKIIKELDDEYHATAQDREVEDLKKAFPVN